MNLLSSLDSASIAIWTYRSMGTYRNDAITTSAACDAERSSQLSPISGHPNYAEFHFWRPGCLRKMQQAVRLAAWAEGMGLACRHGR